MGSTDISTYLQYIGDWESESDENIEDLISELNLFLKLDDLAFGPAIDEEFNILTNLATEVCDATIDADALQIAADAAAVAAFWSFGFGMAAFVVLEGDAMLAKASISKKSKKLQAKLNTADIDIASKINGDVKSYITKYKKNNNLIATQAPKGIDNKRCRSFLMQFMANVQRLEDGAINAKIFRKYARSARVVYKSKQIEAVYDALDYCNLNGCKKPMVKNCFDALVGLKLPKDAALGIKLLQGVSLSVMGRQMKIANETIEECAKAAGIPTEEVDSSAFGMMDMVGKFALAVGAAMSVVDVILNILDIVEIEKQCKRMCDELNGTIKDNYKSFYSAIQDSSKRYKKALKKNKESGCDDN